MNFKKIRISIILSIFMILELLTGCQTSHINENNITITNDNIQEKSEPVEEDSNNTENVSISGITFGTTYEQVVKIIGEPLNIIQIQDDTIIDNKGYFSILEYENFELVINDSENFKITPNSTVVEIDAISEQYFTSKGIHIGSTIEDVISKYGFEKKSIYDKSDEGTIPDMRIVGLRKDNQKFVDYDKYCFITENDYPRALIFLFKNNEVVRILIRHLTAD